MGIGPGGPATLHIIVNTLTIPIPSMGLLYLPTWMVDFHGKN